MQVESVGDFGVDDRARGGRPRRDRRRRVRPLVRLARGQAPDRRDRRRQSDTFAVITDGEIRMIRSVLLFIRSTSASSSGPRTFVWIATDVVQHAGFRVDLEYPPLGHLRRDHGSKGRSSRGALLEPAHLIAWPVRRPSGSASSRSGSQPRRATWPGTRRC